jgi:dephospho-CoA kinase
MEDPKVDTHNNSTSPTPSKQTTVIIGLTGGICGGKSTISEYMLSLSSSPSSSEGPPSSGDSNSSSSSGGDSGSGSGRGVGVGVRVVNADLLGHRAGTAAASQLVQVFGKEIENPDGSINRRVLGAIVFADKSKLKQLTDILWPIIKEFALAEFQTLKADPAVQVIVFEAAVLLEAGWHDVVDETWVLEVSPEVAKQRLMTRNKLTEEDAMQRINSQLTNEERRLKATVLIPADDPLPQVKEKVLAEWNNMLHRHGLVSNLKY